MNIRMMQRSHIKFILKLFELPNKQGYAESKSEGAIAKVLYKKDWLIPMGKEYRRVLWRLNVDKATPKVIREMREVMK